MPKAKAPWPERFWSKVDKSGFCWIWRGTIEVRGYGVIRIDGKIKKAHRIAYELLRGPIPNNWPLDHLCENTLCVNPFHTEAVPNGENLHRYALKTKWLGGGRRPKKHGKSPRRKRIDEMKTVLELKVGDMVTWRSQSQGSWTQKTGVVAAIIPSHSRPDATLWPRLFSSDGPGGARRHQSYIVLVDKRPYWPIVTKLKLVAA